MARRVALSLLIAVGVLGATGCRVDDLEPNNYSFLPYFSDPIRFVGRGYAGAEFEIQGWVKGNWDTERIVTIDANGNFDEQVQFESQYWELNPDVQCFDLTVRLYYPPNPITPEGFVFAAPAGSLIRYRSC